MRSAIARISSHTNVFCAPAPPTEQRTRVGLRAAARALRALQSDLMLTTSSLGIQWPIHSPSWKSGQLLAGRRPPSVGAVADDLEVLRVDAHLQELVVHGRALDQVDRAGDDVEGLRGMATTRGQPSGGVGDVSAVECLRVVGKHKARMTV